MKFSTMKQPVLLLTICLLFSQQLNAKLIFTAPPRETPTQGQKLYGPLVKHLSQLLGEQVVYKHPRNWLRYQRDIRRDTFDIIFDGPHFAAWRILHISHTPLVKLPGNLDFYFVTKNINTDIKKPEDLVLKKVCAIPPPNLTSLVLLNVLNSPVREPIIKSVKGGMPAVFKQLFNNECIAAVVRQDYFNKRLSGKQRSKLKIIYSSRKIPNQVITVSNKISKTNQKKIIRSLTKGKGISATKGILKRFSGKRTKAFISAKKEDFKGQNELLEGVILGW